MVFTTLVFSNVILSLVNRSFYYSVFASLKNKNIWWPIYLTSLIVYISPIARFFDVLPLQLDQIVICIAVSAVSVLWLKYGNGISEKITHNQRNIKIMKIQIVSVDWLHEHLQDPRLIILDAILETPIEDIK
jgi:magnesium-transporting ATPase (P-type)